MKGSGSVNLVGRKKSEIMAKDNRADRYAVMHKRGILEAGVSYEQLLDNIVTNIVAIDQGFSNGEPNTGFAQSLKEHVAAEAIVFGTPVLRGLGARTNHIAAACTVVDFPIPARKADQAEAIGRVQNLLAQGLGIGIDLSESQDPVGDFRKIDKFLYKLDQGFVNKRPVAAMVTLDAKHPAILDFVGAKRMADFSKSRANISVFVTEELFKRAAHGEHWDLIDPYTQAVVDTIPAKKLIEAIALQAHYCGEPGILFKDRLNQENSTPQWAYKSVAPCGELAMSDGDACHFSYLNLAKFVKITGGTPAFDRLAFAQAISVLTRTLDNVVEHTIKHANNTLPLVALKRRIGLGITGFTNLLIRLGVAYQSEEAFELALQINEALYYYSKQTSVELAKKRGAFPAFGESKYQDREWLQRKLKYINRPSIEQNRWQHLFEDINTYGIRNATTISFPPTGTSSYIVNSCPSFEPLNQGFDDEALLRASEAGNACNYIAQQLSPEDHLRIAKAFQWYAEGSASKTVNFANNVSPKDIENVLWECYSLEMRGISVFRANCLNERAAQLETA